MANQMLNPMIKPRVSVFFKGVTMMTREAKDQPTSPKKPKISSPSKFKLNVSNASHASVKIMPFRSPETSHKPFLRDKKANMAYCQPALAPTQIPVRSQASFVEFEPKMKIHNTISPFSGLGSPEIIFSDSDTDTPKHPEG